MNEFSIVMAILSAIFVIASVILGQAQFMPLAQYTLLFAILAEVGCMHETLKEK